MEVMMAANTWTKKRSKSLLRAVRLPPPRQARRRSRGAENTSATSRTTRMTS